MSVAPQPSAPGRVSAMDGLRGWAALSVAAFHFFWETFGVRFPEIRTVAVASVMNGRLAIAVFLGISGYVLTIRGWRNPDKSGIRRSLLRRYTRLTIPIVVSCLIVYLLMVLGLTANVAASDIVNRGDWLGGFLRFRPDLTQMAVYASLLVYSVQPEIVYNNFLWTMLFEFWGSYLILTLCLFERRARFPAALLVVATALMMPINLIAIGACFPIGGLIALLQCEGRLPVQRSGVTGWLALAVIAAAMVCGGIIEVNGESPQLTTLLGAVILVAAIASPQASRLLSAPISQFLGKLSYPLYLMHFAVVVSLTSHLIVAADRAGMLTVWTALGIGAISLVVTLAAAWCFLPIERLTAAVGRWLTSVVAARRQPVAG